MLVMGACLYSQHAEEREADLLEFETSLVYIAHCLKTKPNSHISSLLQTYCHNKPLLLLATDCPLTVTDIK